jgi:hypothetical protein
MQWISSWTGRPTLCNCARQTACGRSRDPEFVADSVVNSVVQTGPSRGTLFALGGRSSAGRASVCGTEGRGFEPRRSPESESRDVHPGGARLCDVQHRPAVGADGTVVIPPGRPYTRPTTCASSSTAEQRTLNPQVLGSKPRGRTTNTQLRWTGGELIGALAGSCHGTAGHAVQLVPPTTPVAATSPASVQRTEPQPSRSRRGQMAVGIC